MAPELIAIWDYIKSGAWILNPAFWSSFLLIQMWNMHKKTAEFCDWYHRDCEWMHRNAGDTQTELRRVQEQIVKLNVAYELMLKGLMQETMREMAKLPPKDSNE